MDLSSIQIGRTFSILVKTMPILLVRLGVYLLFWLVSLVYLTFAFGAAWLLSHLHAFIGVIVVLVAFGVMVPFKRLARQYFLFMIQAAHLAVVAELLAGRSLPEGKSQLTWGKEQVIARFGQVNVMFVVDNLVRAIVRRFTGVVSRTLSFIPGDAGRSLASAVNKVIRFATDYIDEAILARAFWEREENMWKAAKDGVILYGMVWKPLLMNAVALMLLSYVPALLVLLVVVLPITLIMSLVSTTLAAWAFAVFLVFAWMVKAAVGDAFAMISMVAAYQKATEFLTPDAAVERKIEDISDKFKELKKRALGETQTEQPVEPAVAAANP